MRTPPPKHTLRATDIFIDPAFPLRAERVASHDASGLHGHEFHELVVIEAGRGRHTIDDVVYPIAAGDVFLIKGPSFHAYTDVDGLSLVNLLFDPDLLNLALADLCHLPGYHVLFHVEPELRRCGAAGRLRLGAVQLDEASARITALIEELSRRRPGYRFMAIAQVRLLIGLLARWGSEEGAAGRDPLLRLGELLSYIDRHCDEAISPAWMASRVAMSESALLRAFRRVTGLPPMDYVLNTRIDRAARLLGRPDPRITDIAFLCGFTDANYFSRIFRQRRGVSPREYRRRARGA